MKEGYSHITLWQRLSQRLCRNSDHAQQPRSKHFCENICPAAVGSASDCCLPCYWSSWPRATISKQFMSFSALPLKSSSCSHLLWGVGYCVSQLSVTNLNVWKYQLHVAGFIGAHGFRFEAPLLLGLWWSWCIRVGCGEEAARPKEPEGGIGDQTRTPLPTVLQPGPTSCLHRPQGCHQMTISAMDQLTDEVRVLKVPPLSTSHFRGTF